MEDEIARLVERIESDANALQTLGFELTDAEATPLSADGSQAFRSRALPLMRQVEQTRRAITELANRCGATSVESSEVTALRNVAVEVAGEIGSLSAIVDLATGELSGWGNPNKSRKEIGADILRTARDLRRPALLLSRVRAMKSPKRFSVGTSVRISRAPH